MILSMSNIIKFECNKKEYFSGNYFVNFYKCDACGLLFATGLEPDQYLYCPNCSDDEIIHVGTGQAIIDTIEKKEKKKTFTFFKNKLL